MTVNDLLIMVQSLRFTCWVQGTHTLEFTGVLGMPIAYFHIDHMEKQISFCKGEHVDLNLLIIARKMLDPYIIMGYTIDG